MHAIPKVFVLKGDKESIKMFVGDINSAESELEYCVPQALPRSGIREVLTLAISYILSQYLFRIFMTLPGLGLFIALIVTSVVWHVGRRNANLIC